MALGASLGDMLRLVLGKGTVMVAVGVAAGFIGSLALTRALASLLFGVSARDPMTFVVVALLLSIVALVACYIPARRAAKVDPIVALRCE